MDSTEMVSTILNLLHRVSAAELRKKNPNNEFCNIKRTESLFQPNFFNHSVDEASVVSTRESSH